MPALALLYGCDGGQPAQRDADPVFGNVRRSADIAFGRARPATILDGDSNPIGVTPAPVAVDTTGVELPEHVLDPETVSPSRRWLKPDKVSYALDNKPLSELLKDFCLKQGVAALVSDKIKGAVSGTFTFEDAGKFLNILCRNEKIIWYYDGGMVYFYHQDELQTEILRLGNVGLEEIEHALSEMQLLDERYPLRCNSSSLKLVMLHAPPRYIELIKQLHDEFADSVSVVKAAEIFKLNNAWAEDQVVQYMGKDVVLPGVAALLRQIVAGGESIAPAQPDAAEGKMLKGSGLVGKKKAAAAAANAAPDKLVEAKIIADRRLNAVIIWDVRERMPYYRQLIEKLDQPVDLVEIRVAIIDVEITHSRSLGVNWEVNNYDYGKKIQGTGTLNKPAAADASAAINGLSYSTIYTHGLDKLMAKVNALAATGDAKVLSRPAVLTMDNIQAVLEHTETFYVKLQGQDEVDLVDVTAGTILKVTPHIITEKDENDGVRKKIKLMVHIEDGTDNSGASSLVDGLPRVKKSTVDTLAVVGEEQALVIGGHYHEEKRSNDSGLPILQKIPGLGHAFKNSSVSSSKVERLFVMQPRIVRIDDITKTPRVNRTMSRTVLENDLRMPE